MFDYSEKYIYQKDNFIMEEDRLKVLNYMEAIPYNNMQRDIRFFEDIEDPEIADIIKKYEKLVYTEILSKYAPQLDLRIEHLSWMRRLELVRWTNGAGLGAHRDGHSVIPDEPELSLSTLLYLNDDFIGGEIVFEEFGLEIRPKPGDLIIFPSYFLHEVKQVIKNKETGSLRCTIPFFYTFEARKFGEYTHFSYLGQIEEHKQGKGEYFDEQRRDN